MNDALVPQGEMSLNLRLDYESPDEATHLILRDDTLEVDVEAGMEAALQRIMEKDANLKQLLEPLQPLIFGIISQVGSPLDLRDTSISYDGEKLRVVVHPWRRLLNVRALPYTLEDVPEDEPEKVYAFLSAYDQRRAARFAELGEPTALPAAPLLIGLGLIGLLIFFLGRRR